MDEAENCDRIAIIDHGVIVAIDTPEALKAMVGADQVRITTADDRAACAELARRFGISACQNTGSITFAVSNGEQFVPQLFSELGIAIRSIKVSRPSLNDVFMSYTGSAVRDAGGGSSEHNRNIANSIRGK
jgi:ABC-2 type transport system ATP-binding protein